MSRLAYFGFGLLALAIGLLLTFGDLFLLDWNRAAGAASDIRARGPWLLGLYVPLFAAATAVILLAIADILARRRFRLAIRLAVPLAATLVATGVLYLDPATTVWRLLTPLRGASAAGPFAFDAAMLAIGAWLLTRRPALVHHPAARLSMPDQHTGLRTSTRRRHN